MFQINIGRVKGKIAEKGYNIGTLASVLGVDRNTVAKYMKNPEEMKYRTIVQLAECLCDDYDEAISIFFTKKVTKKVSF